MIYDTIADSGRYKGISPLLDRAMDFLGNMDVSALNPGKNAIEGDDLFVMLFDYETIDESEAFFEAHRKYIDIQLVLSGRESIRSCHLSETDVLKPYDVEGDAILYRLSAGTDHILEPGVFALFMPGELHAPKIRLDEKSDVRKVVVKIKV